MPRLLPYNITHRVDNINNKLVCCTTTLIGKQEWIFYHKERLFQLKRARRCGGGEKSHFHAHCSSCHDESLLWKSTLYSATAYDYFLETFPINWPIFYSFRPNYETLFYYFIFQKEKHRTISLGKCPFRNVTKMKKGHISPTYSNFYTPPFLPWKWKLHKDQFSDSF